MRRSSVLWLLLLVCGTLLGSGVPTMAQGSAWTLPLEVGGGWFPDLAAGPDGSVHIIWHSGMSRDIVSEEETKDRRDALMYRELRGGTWSEVNNIFVNDFGVIGLTVRNSIAMGADGRLHVLFRREFNIDYFNAPWEQAWSAGVWSKPFRIGAGYYTALATDSKGRVHALWTQGVPDDPETTQRKCQDCANLFYRYSDEHVELWSWPANLSHQFEGANRPQIKIDPLDRIHVVWDEGFDWYVGQGKPQTGVYRRSDDGGQTWSTTIFGLADDTIMQTTLALDAQNNPMVVYRSIDDGRLFFQTSPDGGTNWNDPAEIPGVEARNIEDNKLDNYTMATDSAGNIHLLMVGFTEDASTDTPALLHLTWNGTAWSVPEVIMQNELFPEWPRVVVAGGNQLHVVWFTRDTLFAGEDNSNILRVWYSGKTLDVPPVPPPPIFTPTPVVMPTETPMPVLPTPIPTLQPNAAQAPVLEGQPAWEGPGLGTIAMSLLPLIGIIIVVGGFTRKGRRR